MRATTKTVQSPVYAKVISSSGEEVLGELLYTETTYVTEITADAGCHFVRKSDNAVQGDMITLGTDDFPQNYREE